MSRTVLVTGGCGFIGVNFVRYWRQKYPADVIVNLDKLTYSGNRESVRDLEGQDGYYFVQCDLADDESLGLVFYEFSPDLVVHFAAESHVDRSIAGPRPFVMSNIVGTFNLLEECRKRETRFHHVSTDEVFGSLELSSLSDPSVLPLRSRTSPLIGENIQFSSFSEKTPYNPRSPYSASKAASDHLVRAYFHTYGLPITISNCSNNYGPYQYPEKLLSLAITNLLRGKKVPLYGDGMNVREWLHVSDHCEAIDRIIEAGRLGETYMVGSLIEKPNKEVIDFVLAELGMGEEMIEYVEDRPGHDRRYSVDVSKIKSELGWEAKVGFEEGMRETIAWYKEHEDWWGPLLEESQEFAQRRLEVLSISEKKQRSLRRFKKHINNAAFIDGQNVHMGVKALGWQIDWGRFRVYLKERYGVRDAYYYIGYLPAYEKLYCQLEKQGYLLVHKPAFANSKGIVKGNCDADMVLKVLQTQSQYNEIILATGDGDFYSLVRHLLEIGKMRTVLSPSYKTSSFLLRQEAGSKMAFIDRLEQKLSYTNTKERAPLEDETTRWALS
jgi:dTDP-glucose 4,6-dehydratase